MYNKPMWDKLPSLGDAILEGRLEAAVAKLALHIWQGSAGACIQGNHDFKSSSRVGGTIRDGNLCDPQSWQSISRSRTLKDVMGHRGARALVNRDGQFE